MEKLYRVQMNRHGAPDFSTAKEVTNLSTKKDCFTCGMGRDEETGYPILLYNPEKVMHEVLDANDRAVSLAEVCKLIEETYEMCPRDWQKLRELPSVDRPQKVIAQITFDEEKLHEIVKEVVEHFKEEYEITDRPQGWIPCNERLPDLEEYVFVTLECGETMIMALDWDDGKIEWKTQEESLIYDDEEVIAWQSLPEPWKGADE